MSRIWIPGAPVAYPRARSSRSGARFYVEPYASWRETAAWEVAAQREGTLEGPVWVSVKVQSDGLLIKTGSAVAHIRPKGVRGDLDNYLKAALDSLQAGGQIGDDRQVVHLLGQFKGDSS